jgi:hypothetical protein
MSCFMADTTLPEINSPPYEDPESAPFIYFDIVPTHGTFSGAVQIELASRILIPAPGDGVEVRFRSTGHLRCSPSAAGHLRDALTAALKMLEQPQEEPAAARN